MSSLRSLTLVGLSCASLLGGCDRQSGSSAQPEPTPAAIATAAMPAGVTDRSHKGEPLPDFVVTRASGKRLNLASLKGKPALVNLWATWCAPCVEELPTLNALAGKLQGKLKVVTVSQDLQADNVARFLKDKGGANLDPWLDPKTELSFRYAAPTLPTTILYDAKGEEVWRYVGGHDWMAPDAAKMLGEAGV